MHPPSCAAGRQALDLIIRETDENADRSPASTFLVERRAKLVNQTPIASGAGRSPNSNPAGASSCRLSTAQWTGCWGASQPVAEYGHPWPTTAPSFRCLSRRRLPRRC